MFAKNLLLISYKDIRIVHSVSKAVRAVTSWQFVRS